LSSALSGCFFRPAIDDDGYAPCSEDVGCAAGRTCEAELCVPPPWNDAAYARRRLVVVQNHADVPLREGSAIVLRIGTSGLFSASDLGVDGRLRYYEGPTSTWRKVPAWRDVYDDHLLLYVPLQETVAAASEGQLLWVESQTGTREPGIDDEADAVFELLYEDFAQESLAERPWRIHGGQLPSFQDQRIVVKDNEQLVSTRPLVPPFSLTWKGRINGVSCEQVYVGLMSDDEPGFHPPSAGFFIGAGLEAFLEVAPTEESVPQQPPDLSSVRLDTATRRYRIDVGDERVRFLLDGEVLGETETLRFEGESLHFVVDVDGACSYELELVHATEQPFVIPTLRTEPVVEYQLFD
jgi:hypothetical protein